MGGYIKLHRRVLNSVVFSNPYLWQVWTYCLLRVNYTTKEFMWNGAELELKPGQFVFGRNEASRDCRMPASTLWDQMRKLRAMKKLDIKSNNKWSLVTIYKWKKYQLEIADSADVRTLSEKPDS